MSKTYLEYNFHIEPVVPWSEIVMARLSEYDFESFEITDSGFKAYALKEAPVQYFEDFDTVAYPEDVAIHYEVKEIPPQNWNALWERNFQPVIINEECVIRAAFHKPFKVPYELIITPKMSFGTGHHETTSLMILEMFEMNFSKKSVLDMGCGTGVLSILAAKKGASVVDAVDVDAWCVENTLENCQENHCSHINVHQASDISTLRNTYDVVLANINKNVLLEQLKNYVEILKPKGALLLSGFYKSDVPEMTGVCEQLGCTLDLQRERNNWVMAKYQKYV